MAKNKVKKNVKKINKRPAGPRVHIRVKGQSWAFCGISTDDDGPSTYVAKESRSLVAAKKNPMKYDCARCRKAAEI